jgi:2-methylisocitrate lyase-like PEP mutase family enzyme
MLLTARAENALYGAGDLADSIARLQAYRDVGADVVYAPGLSDLADIGALVEAVGVPVNVLLWGDAFTPEAAAAVGVRRLSTGSALAGAAFEAASLAASALPSGPVG